MFPTAFRDTNKWYYDATFVNAAAGESKLVQARFSDQRALPLLDDTTGYNVALTKLSLQGVNLNLPLLVPPLARLTSASDPPEIYTAWYVGVRYTLEDDVIAGLGYATSMVYASLRIPSAYPSESRTDPNSRFYWVMNQADLITALNRALREASALPCTYQTSSGPVTQTTLNLYSHADPVTVQATSTLVPSTCGTDFNWPINSDPAFNDVATALLIQVELDVNDSFVVVIDKTSISPVPSVTRTITVPPGSYTPTQLATVLQTLLDAAFASTVINVDWTVTYNPSTLAFTFSVVAADSGAVVYTVYVYNGSGPVAPDDLLGTLGFAYTRPSPVTTGVTINSPSPTPFSFVSGTPTFQATGPRSPMAGYCAPWYATVDTCGSCARKVTLHTQAGGPVESWKNINATFLAQPSVAPLFPGGAGSYGMYLYFGDALLTLMPFNTLADYASVSGLPWPSQTIYSLLNAVSTSNGPSMYPLALVAAQGDYECSPCTVINHPYTAGEGGSVAALPEQTWTQELDTTSSYSPYTGFAIASNLPTPPRAVSVTRVTSATDLPVATRPIDLANILFDVDVDSTDMYALQKKIVVVPRYPLWVRLQDGARLDRIELEVLLRHRDGSYVPWTVDSGGTINAQLGFTRSIW